jgi:hypothetical protein
LSPEEISWASVVFEEKASIQPFSTEDSHISPW